MRTLRYRPPLKPPPGAAHINWGHPLARGLVGYWLFNEGGGESVQDLTSKITGTFASLGTVTPKWRGTTEGIALEFGTQTGDDNYITVDTVPARLSVKTWSIFARVIPLTVGVGAFRRIISADGADGDNRFSVLQNATDPPKLVYQINNTGTNASAGAFAVDRWNSVGVTSGGTAGDGTVRFFLQGKQDATTYADNNDPTDINHLRIAIHSLGTDVQSWRGFISWIGLWNRVVTPGEAMTLHADPYAFLAPLAPRVRWDMVPTSTDVFFENVYPIESGMKPQTAAGMGGVLVA